MKSWVRGGRRSPTVSADMVDRGERIWRRELAAMASHGVLPRVIVLLTE